MPMNVMKIFRIRSTGFSGVVGTIDGCHIPIRQSPENANDYYNRKDFHSIVLRGVCDHTGKSIDCLIGRPGRTHDAAIFEAVLYIYIYTRLIDPDNPLLPPHRHILRDSAYPLLRNVMTPFRDNSNLTQAQLTFNTRLSSIRSIIERAYTLLKGKWRRLKCFDVKSVEMANSVVAAACILHNFILLHNEADMRNNNNFNDNIANGGDNDDDDIENEAENGDNDGRVKRQEIMGYL